MAGQQDVLRTADPSDSHINKMMVQIKQMITITYKGKLELTSRQRLTNPQENIGDPQHNQACPNPPIQNGRENSPIS